MLIHAPICNIPTPSDSHSGIDQINNEEEKADVTLGFAWERVKTPRMTSRMAVSSRGVDSSRSSTTATAFLMSSQAALTSNPNPVVKRLLAKTSRAQWLLAQRLFKKRGQKKVGADVHSR